VKDQSMDDERLDTVFCEVNGRPITAVSDSPNDFESLPPNHLLLIRYGSHAPLGELSLSYFRKTMEACSAYC